MNIPIDNARETRIFMPFNHPYPDKNWANWVLGEIIKPFTEKFRTHLDWFWFCRCHNHREADSGGCQIEKLGDDFFCPDDHHRSIKLRFRINGADPARNIEGGLLDLVKGSDCAITDIRDYAAMEDLASERFAPKDISESKKIERAKLITSFFHISSNIFLHCLTKNDANIWTTESCPHELNYFGTMLDSSHHLF